jgi:glycosyltransferase involved in cell wall biosynthesis
MRVNKPRISVYGTVYNNANLLEDSLQSILKLRKQIKNLEIVIVDNFSQDGTWEILQNYSRKYRNFKIYQVKCSRGRGRQIAYWKSTGELIFYVDFDVVHSTAFRKFIIYLASNYKPKNNEIWLPSFFCSREIMKKVGGWRDFNFGEDWELFARAISRGFKLKHVMIPVGVDEITTTHREKRYTKTTVSSLKRRIRNVIDAFRSGCFDLRTLWFDSPHLLIPQKILITLLLLYSCVLLGKVPIYRGKTTPEISFQSVELVLPSEIGINDKWLYCSVRHNQVLYNKLCQKIGKIKNLKNWKGRYYSYFFTDFKTVKKYIENNEKKCLPFLL